MNDYNDYNGRLQRLQWLITMIMNDYDNKRTSHEMSEPSGPLQDTDNPAWSFLGMGRVMVAFCCTWVSVPVPLEVVSLQLISSSEIPPSSP